jgi:hypothetical protein
MSGARYGWHYGLGNLGVARHFLLSFLNDLSKELGPSDS